MLDNSIREQLNTAETSLLSALVGEKDLAIYHTELMILLDTISRSTSADRLDTSTTALARNVAMRIASITDCLVDIKHESHGLSDGLHDGWRDILAKHFSADASGTSHSQQASDYDTSPPHPDYLSSTYKWLLANLHNPYPTVEVKEGMASRAGCSVTAINSWFISVRRRIGWTAICRDHFRNCRADAVDAAFRALVREDPCRSLSPEITQAFLVMKTTAEGLYSSTFAKCMFTIDSDEITKAVIETDGLHPDNSKDFQGPEQLVGGGEDLLDRPSAGRTLYSATANPLHPLFHSPSPVPTLESSFSSESEDGGNVNPPIVTGRKRTGPSDEPDLAYGSVCMRKRRRVSVTSDRSTEVSSCDMLSVTKPLGNSSPPTSPEASSQVISVPHHPRKRRLSDTSGQFHPKRPQGVPNGPRVQAVSNPLPESSATESSVNDWFNINFPDVFDIPPPVDVDGLDPSALWQVELFSNYRIPETPRINFQKGNSRVTRTSCPPVYTSQPMVDVAPSDISEFSFLSFDDYAYDQAFLMPDTNGSQLVPTPFPHSDLSPLGMCSELSCPADPCDFLGSVISQSFVTVDDYGGGSADPSTTQTPTLWVNNLSGPLRSQCT
ncbi:hypothetical protein BKA83DRAFT_4201244 [Pisolithus microcarpus]|nr:hypothetical protein BKA83DRAFT_4201244 [Pisolithus microcarpus]